MEKYDFIVIGAGPGGYPAAIRAAQQGAAVALVEKEALGGTCLNWGCIPTKTLIAASALLENVRHADTLGLRIEKAACDYAAMIKNKDQVVAKLRGGIGQLLKSHGVTLLEGQASFTAHNRVSLQQGKKTTMRLEAKRIIIAAGSTSAMPAFLPQSELIVDSRAFLERTQLPQSLIIMGGGVIGCEFACMAAQLGAEVTIVELLEDILLMLDKDLRSELRRVMEQKLKIKILTGAPLEQITAGRDSVKGLVNGQAIEAALMLVSIGRQPNTKALDLAQAGLRLNPKGFLDADPKGRTNIAGIYAIGDVTGGTQLAHAATAQGLAAVDQALGCKNTTANRIVPACIFTAPEIATTGLSEQDAQKQQRAIHTAKFPFVSLGKAVATNETNGFVKWIADEQTGQLLGAQAIGAHATELIATATIAIQSELTATEFAATIQAHPTLSEAWMEAAHALHGQCIHAPARRKKTARNQ